MYIPAFAAHDGVTETPSHSVAAVLGASEGIHKWQ